MGSSPGVKPPWQGYGGVPQQLVLSPSPAGEKGQGDEVSA